MSSKPTPRVNRKAAIRRNEKENEHVTNEIFKSKSPEYEFPDSPRVGLRGKGFYLIFCLLRLI